MKIGWAITGSFCTFAKTFEMLEHIKTKYDSVVPIMSENASSVSTRFGTAEENTSRVSGICGCPVINTIAGAEPIGPKRLLDILVIAPCTGNTLGKLANGITDTAVTMAAKAQLRNDRPVLIAVSTNDGLAASARSISLLINRKNHFFVPFGQDDPVRKETSLVADFKQIPDAIEAALEKRQLMPMLLPSGNKK
ncbi:MAG: dipicolinate synthase subunit B [Oscillospiraceae bacterium]|nr:dipicolinate synthase subunit B [Oscillospiraceae bacterium]